jgi:predicted amidophosphoribosyltransferase
MWSCKLTDRRTIEVRVTNYLKGEYLLLEEPYCDYCASPNTTTETCMYHSRCYGFDKAYAMGSYYPSRGDDESRGWNDLLSKHIRGLKMFPNYSFPIGLGLSLCIENLFTNLLETNLIVPVPKFPSEFKVSNDGEHRQYNQANELASVVSQYTKNHSPVVDALIKIRAQKMKELSEDERWEVVNGLYAFNSSINVLGKKILLVDDVFTSGATISECSSVLLQNGAQNVKVLVAGRDTFDNGV